MLLHSKHHNQRFKSSVAKFQNCIVAWLPKPPGSKRADLAACQKQHTAPATKAQKLVNKASLMCRLQKITVRNSQPHVFVLLWQAATSHSLHTEAALYILVVLTGAWIVCSLSQLTTADGNMPPAASSSGHRWPQSNVSWAELPHEQCQQQWLTTAQHSSIACVGQ